jgi:hypothetical protein
MEDTMAPDSMPDQNVWTWTITFDLAAGYAEDDAIELYEWIEQSPRTLGAVLSASREHAALDEEQRS